MSTFDKRGKIPPDKGIIISCLGKKRSGKSVMALQIFRSYPHDRVVIDIAGDDGPVRPDDPTVVRLEGNVHTDSLPSSWPEYARHDNKPMTLVYVPDAGSHTFAEDMDAVVGLALDHGGCCLLVHEVGVLARANRTPANTRRVLMHNRHHQLTVIFCGPRPADIDPLVVAQSDLIYAFEMPNRGDRERIADQVGWDRDDFHAAMRELGPHEYLLYDANVPKPAEGEDDMRLIHYPALPEQVVKTIEAWAHPAGRPTALKGPR